MVVTGAGPGDHGRRDRGRRPRAIDRRQHPAPVRAGGQPVHRRRPQAGGDEVLLHPQAHADEGVRRLRRRCRAASAPSTRPSSCSPCSRRARPSRRRSCCSTSPGGTYWQAWERFLREEVAAGAHLGRRLSLYRITDDVDEAVDGDPRLLPQLPLHPLRRRPARRPAPARRPRPRRSRRSTEEFADICARGAIEASARCPPRSPATTTSTSPASSLHFDRIQPRPAAGAHRRPQPAAVGAATPTAAARPRRREQWPAPLRRPVLINASAALQPGA